MKNLLRHGLALALALLPLWAAAAPVLEQWPLPWKHSQPRSPAVAPDGRVWFSLRAGDYLGVFDPAMQTFQRFALPPGTAPEGLAVDAAGRVWYAGSGNGHIGRLDPDNGAVTPYPLPKPTLDPRSLALDGRGHLWFTLPQSNLIGRLELVTGNLRFAAPASTGARPGSLLVDGRGHPRVALAGSNRLATLGPRSLRLLETPLPPATRPRALTQDPEGDLWYSAPAQGHLGRYRPHSGTLDEWPLPAGSAPARPGDIAADRQGRIWIADTGPTPNRLLMFDPESGRFKHSVDVPDPIGGLHLDPLRNAIWFSTGDTLGRLRAEP